MKKSSYIMLLAALMPLALYFLPIWNISLKAPQYPEPIGMDIYIDRIADHNPNDIQNINLLNHYVGMKYIPEHMKEFEVFPLVVAIMSFLGVLIAFFKNRWFYFAWGTVYIILGAIGLYDFYLWEYDYGHDLNPNAAIQIPGQGYQPPLFGKKMILNFEAVSLPMSGAFFLGLGILMAFYAWYTMSKPKNLQS